MKMFKKLMAVALVGVMALSMLTGCAVTNAIAENKAENALENAWKTEKNENVNFKSLSVESSMTNGVKSKIEDGTVKVEDGKTFVGHVTYSGKKYTVVVVTEPKSATKYNNWKNVAKNVLDAAGWETGIWVEGTNDKTAKVDVTVDIKGMNATDPSKKDTYAMFVFAADKAAYNK